MNQLLIVSSVMLWIVVLLNLFLTLALIRRLNARSNEDGRHQAKDWLQAGAPAPAFTAETLSGEIVTLRTYAGRVTAFIFVSPDCPPCREIMPQLEVISTKAAFSGVEIVLVSTVDATQTRPFINMFNIHLPVLIAPSESNPFLRDYKSPGTPSYCLVDGQGQVQSTGFPNLNHAEWKTLVESWETAASQVSGMALIERRT